MGFCGDMADRDPLHQPPAGKGRVDFGKKHYSLPLLPFEKQLIEVIGCSEEEYRYLAAEAMRRGATRPAGYEHIPDVANDATVIAIISLVLGVVSSAVSFILAPKPKAFGGGETSRRDLGSINGPDRFSPTFGFDSQAELANYGDPIPIAFGRYTGTTGGFLVTPKLVWSRLFSYGTQQAVKLLFVVGEQGIDAGQKPQGIDPPDLTGIFLGNGALDAVFDNAFTFYWKRNTTFSGFSRIKAVNRLYGTRGTPESADPETNDDIYSCPTGRSLVDTGFSSASSLSNNSEFGCYSPIANGSSYRVNFRIVPIVQLERQRDDPGNNLTYERIKISGDLNGTGFTDESDEGTFTSIRPLGQSGTGRNYSRRMGITTLNGAGVSDATGTEERRVNVGDTIQFTIAATQIPEDFYSAGSVKVDDINSELNEQRIAADDSLQIGELFMIGRTTWQVTNRRLSQWRPEDTQDQIVDLRCIDTNPPADNRIGLVSQAMIRSNYLSDTNGANNNLNAGAAFYPLMRFSKGTVRNTRACEVTEIGLRSSVFQRLRGLCNFQTIPSPDELIQAEKDRISLSTGTVSGFVRRSSSFTIFLRPAGLDASGNKFAWQPLGIQFSIVGNQPIDLYNFIRLKHPKRGQYEFQFIPKNGADMRNAGEELPFWQLNSAASVVNSAERSILSADFDTAYGRFTVTTVGKEVRKRDLQKNAEFTSKPGFSANRVTPSYPSAVGVNTYLPDVDDKTTTVTAVTVADIYSNPAGITQGRTGSFTTELFGLADSSPIAEGGIITKQVIEQLPNNQFIEIQYKARKERLPAGNYSGQSFIWVFVEYNIKSSSGGFNSRQEFIVSRPISESNPFRVVPGQGTLLNSGLKFRVAGVQSSVQSPGRSQGVFEEIFTPARNFPVGTKRSVVLDLTVDLIFDFITFKKLQLELTSEVVVVDNPAFGPKLRWATPTITPSRDTNTTTNWNVGDKIKKVFAVSSTNPFAQDYVSTGVGIEFIIQGVSNVELAPAGFNSAREFEGQSQYADVTFYGNFVEKSNASAPEHQITYVNEIVSNESLPDYDRLTICGLVLKASRSFVNLDQIRLWLSNGIPVKRFHPDDAAAPVGPSNLLCDLVYYLLTDNVAGLGGVLNQTIDNAPLVNTADLVETAKFLKTNKLFYDGVIGTASNVRQLIAETAPFFLCNFVISDGKFSLRPALPTTEAGEISTGPVPISQLFTAGNILEDSFELEYLNAEERKPLQAVVRFRQEQRNQLSQERNVVVRWADSEGFTPLESFDVTAYCTSEQHARTAAKYFLSIRKRVTHTIRFRTTPYGLNLAPGDYIKVVTEASPYHAARNGSVGASGAVTSATELPDGQYDILYYKTGGDDVTEAVMTISGGLVAEQALWNSIFTVREMTVSANVYMVEQLTLAEDSTVQISASEFPCDSTLSSVIAQDVTNDSRYIFEN